LKGPRKALKLNKSGFAVLTFPEFTLGEQPKNHIAFLGTRVWAVDGVARIAYLNRRALAPVSFEATESGQYVLEFFPPLLVRSKEGIATATRDFYRWLEERVLLAPERWISWAFFDSNMLP